MSASKNLLNTRAKNRQTHAHDNMHANPCRTAFINHPQPEISRSPKQAIMHPATMRILTNQIYKNKHSARFLFIPSAWQNRNEKNQNCS
jgi:hypothetical protein